MEKKQHPSYGMLQLSRSSIGGNGTALFGSSIMHNDVIPEFLKEEIEVYIGRLYKYPDDARLFPMVAEALQHKIKRHIEKAGVKMIRVHDLRHSHVAYLIHQGVPPLVIKERLGHKDIGITLNAYGHLYPNEQKKLAEMLNGQKMKKDKSEQE